MLELIGLSLPAVGAIFSAMLPILLSMLGSLLTFSLSRVPSIPKYIKVLVMLYKDASPDSKTRKYLTTALLVLGGVLTFMAHSIIPFTAVPVIGIFTTPVATLVSLVVILTTLDLVTNFNEDYIRNFQTIYESKDLQNMQDDLLTMKAQLGPSWNELVQKVQKVFDELQPKVEQLQIEMAHQGKDISKEINNYFSNQLSELVVYIGDEKSSKISLSESEILTIKESLESWQKVSTSLLIGTLSGTVSGMTASSVAAANVMQATWWTPIATHLPAGIQTVFGVKTVVSAATFSALTVATPLALGLTIGTGIFGATMYAFNNAEAEKLSQFLADIIIASLPMLKADEIVDENEKLAIKQLLANPQINQKDRQRVEVAINSNDSFDDLINKNLLYDKKQEKIALKRKLLLSITWQIAKADGKIDEREIELHDRMAKILQIDRKAVLEIRRIITPTFKQLSPSKPESSFFKFFKFGQEKKSQPVTIDVLAKIV